jgi:actin-related protein 6
VVDLGGDSLKVGWSGQVRPQRVVMNAAVKGKRDVKWMVGDQIGGGTETTDPGTAAPSSALAGKSAAKLMDYSGLYVRRPMERGFVVNWELEHQVCTRAFHRSVLDPYNSLTPSAAASLLADSSLLLTLPPCCPPALAKDVDEAMMEKWGFKKYRRMPGAAMAHRAVMDEQYAANTAAAQSTPAAAAAGASKEALNRLCAVVVDSGYSFTHIMPVYQGSVIKSAVKRSVQQSRSLCMI